MSRLTIRWRVTLIAVAVLAAALLLLSFVADAILIGRLEAGVDNVLRNRAAAQSVTLDSSGGQVAVRDGRKDSALDEQSWVFAGGRQLEGSRASTEVISRVQRLSSVEQPTFAQIGERIKLFATPARDSQGKPIATIVVGEQLGSFEHSKNVIRYGMLLLSLAVLLVAAAAIYWAVGRALAPVDTMTRRAAEWSDHDLDQRFDLGEPRDEITLLAATLDTLLARIDATFEREKRVTAEIAHELRTPLAGLRAEAELAMRDAEPAEREALERIVAGADRMNNAIETLLATHRGRVEGESSCDPAAAAESAVAAFQESRPDRQWEVSASRGEAIVDIDEAVLVQTLGPLLDNAARHAAAKVTVDVGRDQQLVTIAVNDDGPGVSDASADIFAPGVSSGERAGLGLPLARRLAETFGAKIVPVDGDGGRFELRIPGRASAARG